MNIALALHNLSKIFYKHDGSFFKAVDNVTLEIPQGQIIGFLGPNGAGKTTTIKMICNVILPSDGEVTVHGYSVTKDRFAALSHIGAVLEGTRNIYWQLTAWQNLMYFGRLKGISGKDLDKNATELLHALDIWDKRNKTVNELSRGTQQKVAIACAVITNPPVILLDEPTLGLDVKASRTVKQWIIELAQKQKKTVLLTTHQLDIAEQVCERIVIMNHGQIIADQPTNDLLKIVHEEQYHISIGGILDRPLDLPGMVMCEKDGNTVFSGAIVDQDELYEKLALIHERKLSLISVTRQKQNLEEVFMKLTHKQEIS